MHPAHGHVQVLGTGHHTGSGPLQGGESEDLGKGGKHADSLGRSVSQEGISLYIVHPRTWL
ncbi:hypothetical protein GCM10007079_11000 [Nocardiopsis terrae]|nr:hypothetical protein GCM10007079_11000 [Nocardiopsis terrae]